MEKTEHPALYAVSPIDGRYCEKTKALSGSFSEAGIIGFRAGMEIDYLIALSRFAEKNGIIRIPVLDDADYARLEHVKNVVAFSEDFALRVKQAEKKADHDVKAVEYVLVEIFRSMQFSEEFIAHCHFGLTSEDVNNISYAQMLYRGLHDNLIPELDAILLSLSILAKDNAYSCMVARTHGQAATPTTFGKEMAIFVQQIVRQLEELRHFKIRVKINGASGNYNGHRCAYPEVDWPQFMADFIANSYKDEGKQMFEMSQFSTQIEDHVSYTELFAILQRINRSLYKLCVDVWLYTSYGMLLQKKKKDQVGSSAMPHKINPLNFENAEANLDVANTLFDLFNRRLTTGRMQRDLSDSTLSRNFGVAFAHSLIAYKEVIKGLEKIIVNADYMKYDLNDHIELLSEPYQLVLKTYGHADAYETLKELTRGENVTIKQMHALLDQYPDIPEEERNRLKELRPETYLGYAPELAEKADEFTIAAAI